MRLQADERQEVKFTGFRAVGRCGQAKSGRKAALLVQSRSSHLRLDAGKGKRSPEGNWDGTLFLCPFGRGYAAHADKVDTKRVKKSIGE